MHQDQCILCMYNHCTLTNRFRIFHPCFSIFSCNFLCSYTLGKKYQFFNILTRSVFELGYWFRNHYLKNINISLYTISPLFNKHYKYLAIYTTILTSANHKYCPIQDMILFLYLPMQNQLSLFSQHSSHNNLKLA